MKIWLKKLVTAFFRPELDFRVRLFNMLAMAGTIISLLALVFSLLVAGGFQMAVINLFMTGLSFGLLYYSYTSGQYQRCYLITIFFIFFVGFGFLFFLGGGYRSGLPSFFIFGTMFTVFMLKDRRLLVVVTVLELLFYTGLCIYGYYEPAQVLWFKTEKEVLADVIVGFVTVSVLLGITMHLSFRMYDSQQRQLEQAREEAIHANQAKSMFLASMSHEIRTPINIILGMNEMVLREHPSKTIAGYIARSQEAGQMFLSLINDILDVSKFEAGKMELLEEAYCTSELVKQLIQMGREQAEKKGLAFSSEISGLPSMLWGDPLHISQIATNLLSNAVKYTEDGSVRLTITGKKMPGGKGIHLSLAVTDTGIGIRKENILSLFEPFTRSETARNLRIEGSGLGLAIVRNLVDLMGGRLFVESECGSGSTFTAEIPQYYVSELSDISRTPAVTLSEQSFFAPQGRILVVDDNKGNVDVVKSLLARTLLQIDTALSGQQCLELVGKNNYHVILMDYMMPQLNGIETLQKLRQINGHVSVVALTADVTTGTRQKLLNAGFANCLAKPVSWTILEQTLLYYLPEQLVMRTTISADNICQNEVENIGRQLKKYDISLEAGLQLLNQNLSQYKTIARIFFIHTCQTAEILTQLAEKNDFTALAHSAHSLKTLSRFIGAVELSVFARRIEQKCSSGEAKYIRIALPLFLHELATTRAGIGEFIQSNQGFSDIEVSAPEYPALDINAMIASVKSHITSYHCTESKQKLTVLLQLEHDKGCRKILEKALTAVEELNFEEAEGLFQQFCNDHKKKGLNYAAEK